MFEQETNLDRSVSWVGVRRPRSQFLLSFDDFYLLLPYVGLDSTALKASHDLIRPGCQATSAFHLLRPGMSPPT